MYKGFLLLALALGVADASAEKLSCNVGGEARFTIIELDSDAGTVSITDRYEQKIEAQITLTRDQPKGRHRYNVAFDYKFDNTPTHFEMIVVPVGGETYRVGVAGYSNYGNKKSKPVLDVTSNDEALCY